MCQPKYTDRLPGLNVFTPHHPRGGAERSTQRGNDSLECIIYTRLPPPGVSAGGPAWVPSLSVTTLILVPFHGSYVEKPLELRVRNQEFSFS